MSDGKTGLQLRSLIKKSGELEISLVDVPTPAPAYDEVVVRVEAGSDLIRAIQQATSASASGNIKASVAAVGVTKGPSRRDE